MNNRRTRLRFLAALLVATIVCAPARADDSLDPVLERAAKHVSAFLDVFSDVNCTERVLQEKLGDNDKVTEKRETTFDYLVLLSNAGGELNLTESRMAAEEKKDLPKETRPLLVSNGFSMLLLVFHPYYASGFQFSLAEGNAADPQLTAVNFQPIPGGRSPAALSIRGREYPLALSGTAWIDSRTGVIRKMAARIGTEMEDIGLRALRSEVEYSTVSFHSSPGTYWLPSSATVEVESRHQRWRNRHVFSGYKRFSVNTREQMSQP
jgi:hypothetical protein